jgi:hypothetical protein
MKLFYFSRVFMLLVNEAQRTNNRIAVIHSRFYPDNIRIIHGYC